MSDSTTNNGCKDAPPPKDFEQLISTVEAGLTKAGCGIGGSDSSSNDDSTKYESVGAMVKSEMMVPSWYGRGLDYWDDVDPTVDGMLGGFADLSPRDLTASRNFLTELAADRPELGVFEGIDGVSCECGAGIGRVSKGLFLPLGFKRCDLVEASAGLISAAPEYIGDPEASRCRFLCSGLQDFNPPPNSYTVVWVQWCIGYLTDVDCVRFFRRMACGLRPGGIICVKDNTCAEEEAFVLDRDDSSVTRSLPYLLILAEQAGLGVVTQKMQEDFPDDIYQVPMIALEVKDGE